MNRRSYVRLRIRGSHSRELGFVAQDGENGVRHRDWASMAEFHLGVEEEQRSPCDMSSLSPGFFRYRVKPVLDSERHQFVIRRVIGDFVDAVPVTVEGSQFGFVTVGFICPAECLAGADDTTEAFERLVCPFRSVLCDGVLQHRV